MRGVFGWRLGGSFPDLPNSGRVSRRNLSRDLDVKSSSALLPYESFYLLCCDECISDIADYWGGQVCAVAKLHVHAAGRDQICLLALVQQVYTAWGM